MKSLPSVGFNINLIKSVVTSVYKVFCGILFRIVYDGTSALRMYAGVRFSLSIFTLGWLLGSGFTQSLDVVGWKCK